MVSAETRCFGGSDICLRALDARRLLCFQRILRCAFHAAAMGLALACIGGAEAVGFAGPGGEMFVVLGASLDTFDRLRSGLLDFRAPDSGAGGFGIAGALVWIQSRCSWKCFLFSPCAGTLRHASRELLSGIRR